MTSNILKIHSQDNIAVALNDLSKGHSVTIENEPITLVDDIDQKHKFALCDLPIGSSVIMYGVLVGITTKDIPKGGLISTDNLKHKTSKTIAKNATYDWKPLDISRWQSKTFMGYHRSDGQVGTDNIWLFFPLVFCENRNIKVLKNTFEREFYPIKKDPLQRLLGNLLHPDRTTEQSDYSEFIPHPYQNVKVRFMTHHGGCGGTREDAQVLASLLAGYVHNPNVAGATVLSLGCQHLEIKLLEDELNQLDPQRSKPVLIFNQQSEGSTDQFLSKIVHQTFQQIVEANQIQRKPASLSQLKIGLECGGSDGFSGITANPVLGHVSDVISSLGGSAILAEFPELCGVEQELANRCQNDVLASKFISLMDQYETAANKVDSGFDMNPSPGNIKDGLITDAIKSAGAVKKSGNSEITDVLDYTEYVTKSGVSLLCTPGNDVESTTGLAGGGANIILFTTGLGTPTGNPITPVVKVSTNSELFKKMPDIIDFNAGTVISEGKSIESVGDELIDLIIEIASGHIKTKAEILGQQDFIPWKRGVSL
ncbi:MAG: altronate dehydratase family protein [Flavobacteriaceae bacterium]|nr:altronate dehydratase family protein [Flavobacteriaceae bacterium]